MARRPEGIDGAISQLVRRELDLCLSNGATSSVGHGAIGKRDEVNRLLQILRVGVTLKNRHIADYLLPPQFNVNLLALEDKFRACSEYNFIDSFGLPALDSTRLKVLVRVYGLNNEETERIAAIYKTHYFQMIKLLRAAAVGGSTVVTPVQNYMKLEQHMPDFMLLIAQLWMRNQTIKEGLAPS
ncbi:MAG: hypothetical protein M1504_00980 [Candidatus Marsarchaeota archaeon]|nr:hypothetical protein [Candidatus Marsarchaeota archaeon]